MKWVIKNTDKNKIFQGNIDPETLLIGGFVLEKRVKDLVETVNGRKHIFNLGHGILPETPINNVHKMINIIKS